MPDVSKDSTPFIEPPMPEGYEGLPRLCNFVQSPDYQQTIWQCILPQTFSIAPEEIKNKITWESSWIIPVGTDGGLGAPNSFDALQNGTRAGRYAYDIGEILAINNLGEWLARPLANLPSSNIDYGKLSIVKPSIAASQQYEMQETSNLSSSRILQAWSVTGSGWLIQHRQNVRYLTPIAFSFFNPAGKKIHSRDLVELYITWGTVTSKNGFIISWGMSDDQHNKTSIVCQSPELHVIAKTTIDYSPNLQLIGLALLNDEVLLLATEIKGNRSVLTGWIINPEKDCQVRHWGTIPLPSRPSYSDSDKFITTLKQAIMLPSGDVILIYTEQWDIRYIKFEISPDREEIRANLWALKFNVTSQQIIWDRLVISSEDPASEAFSINLTDNMMATSVSYEPGLSVAYLPNLAEIWINPAFPDDPERLKYFPHQPRIYQLNLGED